MKIILFLMCLMFLSCENEIKNGKPRTVKVLNGGKVEKEYRTLGDVSSYYGNMFVFVDSATNKKIKITGNVIIEE